MTRFRDANKRRRFLIFGAIALICTIGGFFIFRYVSFNLWITADVGKLHTYDCVLVENGKHVFLDRPDPQPSNDAIDRILVETHGRDRIVIHMSRSEIRFNLTRRRAFTKVFLQTAIPDDRSRSTRINFLAILQCKGSTWRSLATQDITIE